MDLPKVSSAQDGCFLTGQALAAGWNSHALRTSHKLTQLRRGVWILTSVLEGLTPRQQHRIEVRAELLRLGPGWHAARKSVAFLAGVPMLGPAPSTPQLLRAPERASRPWCPDRRIEPFPERQRGLLNGLPITRLDRMALDLAREEPVRGGLVVTDAVLGLGVDPRWLELGLTEMERWHGVDRARTVVGFASGLSESPLESISRWALHEQGLPTPELQVEIWRGRQLLGRADFLWREHRTVGEADGLGKYGDDDATRRAAFAAGKRRAEAFADTGLQVASWGWDDAWSGQRQLAERLRRSFSRGTEQALDPDIKFVATTVADRLRSQH
jgi:hypothetical protein